MTLRRVLLVGFGVTNRAVARALVAHGIDATVIDDHPSAGTSEQAQSIGVMLLAPSPAPVWGDLLAGMDAMVPTPGLPERHAAFEAAAAHGVPLMSEFDLAGLWDDRPVLAVTGTDGKTTVTTMVTEMFRASGLVAEAVGNTEVPLIAAIDDPATDIFVVEASSFRLAHTRHFVPSVATWLNWAPDHLDVHRSLEDYRRAKARIWDDLGPGVGVAVANADDEVVMAGRNPDARTVTFGLQGRANADYALEGDDLVLPNGDVIISRRELARDLPHDVANALAAAATALEGGGSLEGVRSVLREFRGLAHRVELVAEVDGVRYIDDSKATAPHATLAAVNGFDSVVLLAGGRNKGLDLSALAVASPTLRAVVAIGEAADDVRAVFDGRCRVVTAASMAEAVQLATAEAQRGDVVLLSPGCASFDWYRSYAERGDDFVRCVRSLPASSAPEVHP